MGLVQNPKDDLGLEYNNVSFPSANEKYSYTLRGWVVPTSASSPTPTKGIIMVHGAFGDFHIFSQIAAISKKAPDFPVVALPPNPFLLVLPGCGLLVNS
jgi:hypothetical protein